MKRIPTYLFIILGFGTGFTLTLIGVTIEDYFHDLSLRESMVDIHHYYGPLAVGAIFGLLSYLHWTFNRRQSAVKDSMLNNQAKFKSLFENMTDVVCILDAEKRVIDINPASERMFEYSRKEMLTLSIEDLLYKDDQDISDAYFEKLDDSGSYNMYEGRVKTKSGKVIWIQVNSNEINQNGLRIGSQDIIRDITQRKEIEIELQRTVKELDALNHTKDRLFSIIAHDLRSPFNSILGISEIMLEDIRQGDFSTMEKAMANINTSAYHTLLLLENLLSWARSQTGQITFDPGSFNAIKLVGEVTDVLAESAKMKNITLGTRIADDLEVYADQNMLLIVLRNLVSNAIKFTNISGKVDICGKANGEMLEFKVVDNGVGMDDETRTKLLSKEINDSTRGTSNEKGSGLGLVLCQELVEVHKGKLWIESEVGKGSEFKFTIPLRASN